MQPDAGNYVKATDLLADLHIRLVRSPSDQRAQLHTLARRADHLAKRISASRYGKNDHDRREL